MAFSVKHWTPPYTFTHIYTSSMQVHLDWNPISCWSFSRSLAIRHSFVSMVGTYFSICMCCLVWYVWMPKGNERGKRTFFPLSWWDTPFACFDCNESHIFSVRCLFYFTHFTKLVCIMFQIFVVVVRVQPFFPLHHRTQTNVFKCSGFCLLHHS